MSTQCLCVAFIMQCHYFSAAVDLTISCKLDRQYGPMSSLVNHMSILRTHYVTRCIIVVYFAVAADAPDSW
jgi:hypothetical protein